MRSPRLKGQSDDVYTPSHTLRVSCMAWELIYLL